MTYASRFEELFFSVFESLPRQGPGGRPWTERALAACRGLVDAPRVLDLGCGGGAQTLDLVALGARQVVAVDRHAPLVRKLADAVDAQGLGSRVLPVVGDMACPPVTPGAFDLVWSEGALYSIGVDRALDVIRDLLRPGGWLAFTDAVWRVDDPPAEVRAVFEPDSPHMGRADALLETVGSHGFDVVDHFTLPDAAWWDDFYTPMQQRIDALRAAHAGDPPALAALDELAAEPAMHREHGHTYGYEFVVARRG